MLGQSGLCLCAIHCPCNGSDSCAIADAIKTCLQQSFLSYWNSADSEAVKVVQRAGERSKGEKVKQSCRLKDRLVREIVEQAARPYMPSDQTSQAETRLERRNRRRVAETRDTSLILLRA